MTELYENIASGAENRQYVSIFRSKHVVVREFGHQQMS